MLVEQVTKRRDVMPVVVVRIRLRDDAVSNPNLSSTHMEF
jgi:hypothetical protein